MNSTRQINILVLFISVCFFFILYGYQIINPTNIEWLMKSDPGTHFLGWHFFRSEPWTFPLGSIQNYNYPLGTNVVYIDSIPIMAIFMKIFTDFLPNPFQYIGIWLLLSYMLQGFLASLLMREITKNVWLVLIGTAFFLLSPIMFFRAEVHMALATHWLILASLYLYISPLANQKKGKWIILIIITSMIHFFILVMILAVWAGYLLQEILNDRSKKNMIDYSLYVLFTMLTLLFTMWVVGYFSIPISSSGSGGFGIYSMNLLALFNPMSYSFFLKTIPLATIGQGEGFNYLGFGLLLMLALSLLKLPRAIKEINLKKVLPLLIVMVLLFLFSLSNKITFADKFLVQFPYPPILDKLGNALRSSGRMFWPVYYTIIFSIIAINIKYFSVKKALSILSILLIIQIMDFYPWYSSRNLNAQNWDSGFNSKEWQEIAQSVDHITVIPPSIEQNKMYKLAFYAANNNLSINVGYLARQDYKKRNDYIKNVMEQYSSSKIQDRTLYIVKKGYRLLDLEMMKKYLYGKLDGYYIIAPKNNNIKLNGYIDFDNIVDKNISFNSDEVAYLSWSSPESAYRWSLDKESKILFSPIINNENMQGLLSLDIATLGEQEIKVTINETTIGSKRINNAWTDAPIIKFNFNPDILNKKKYNTIKFEFPNARKPGNGDPRVLAMALKSFKIE